MKRGAKRWLSLVPFFLALSGTGTDRVQGAEPGRPDATDARASFQERRERLRHQMAVELEALVRICSLNEQQRQRLEVAARGVVERLLDDRGKPAGPNKPQWRWEEEGLGSAKAELLEHPLWRTTIREVLTPRQMTALERVQSAAKRYQREAAIQFASGLMQNELRLTDEQRGRMESILQKTMPETFCEPELDAGAYTHWLEVEEVQKVLTQTQFAYWLDLQRSGGGAAERLLIR